uniref:Complement C5 n=1 Tax=Lepisosteus oculatus TaxID=7918 RepID=W5ME05_LEPOC
NYLLIKVCYASKTGEEKLLVSHQNGFLFIQTDKPLYTPDQSGIEVYSMFLSEYVIQSGQCIFLVFPRPGKDFQGSAVGAKEWKSSSKLIPKLPLANSYGIWKIEATYSNDFTTSAMAEFEIKEYELLCRYCLYVHCWLTFFPALISPMRYFHGAVVTRADVYLRFGYIDRKDLVMIPKAVRHVSMTNGAVEVEFNPRRILALLANGPESLEQMDGKFLYISATVQETKGGISQDGELANVKYVLSPFSLSLVATPPFVKPGLPYHARVLVKDPLGQPAGGVPVRMEALALDQHGQEIRLRSAMVGQDYVLSGSDGTVLITHNIPPKATSAAFTVETADNSLPRENQAKLQFNAVAYHSDKERYLYIDWASSHRVLHSGDYVSINIYFSQKHLSNIKYYSYQVISKGKIVAFNSMSRVGQANYQNINFRVNSDMVPSSRLLVYYVVTGEGEAELVADSVWMDVQDKCVNGLQAKISVPPGVYKPKEKVDLKIEADEGSSVALSAVDTALYELRSNPKDPLAKVIRHIEQHDLGCGGGGGKDNADVFRLVGLTFMTNANVKAASAADETCSDIVRPKRSVDLVTEIEKKANTFQDLRVQKCCKDGAASYPLTETCASRAQRIKAPSQCKRAFTDCCELANRLRSESIRVYTLARMELDDIFGTANPQVRSYFPESWLWDVYPMPENSRVKTLSIDLPDSLTTWKMKMVGISNKGICVSDPLKVEVNKDVSLDVPVPYKMVRGEQIELRGSVYNQRPYSSRFCVTLEVGQGVCLFKGSRKAEGTQVTPCQRAPLEGQSVHLVSFTLLPLQAGLHTLTFTLDSPLGRDVLVKTLRVVPEGIMTESSSGYTLDPQGIYGLLKRRLEFRHRIPSNLVPGSTPTRTLGVSGELLGAVLSIVLNPSGLKQLTSLPSGSAEVELMGIVPVYYVFHYLEKTNQWDILGPDSLSRRLELKKRLKEGVTSILSFRKKNEFGYSMWKDREASTWLTALVVKTLGQVSNYLEIDHASLCNSIFWLKEQCQNQDGSFKELSTYRPNKLMGAGSDVAEQTLYLTAFTVIGIKNAIEVCPLQEFKDVLAKATEYLSGKLQQVKSVYTKAIVAYALALNDKSSASARTLYTSLESDAYIVGDPPVVRFWKEKEDSLDSSLPNRGTARSVETTAYVLLSTLRYGNMQYANPVMQWLTQEQRFGGGFYSTQDTIVTLEALTEYSRLAKRATLDMKIRASYRTLGDLQIITLTQTKPVVKPIDVPEPEDVIVQTGSSSGVSVVSMKTVYYSTIDSQHTCLFDLKIEVFPADTKSTDFMRRERRIEACAKYKPAQNELYTEAAHTVMEIHLPTGLQPVQEDLETMANGVDYVISQYDILDDKVIIQVESVPSENYLCVGFRVRELFRTGMTSSSLYRVYEYHDPDSQCSRLYTQAETRLLRLCEGQECQCMAAACGQLKPLMDLTISAEDRRTAACLDNIKYAYKVEIISSSVEGDFVNYKAKIKEVIKRGTEQVKRDSEVELIAKATCADVALKNGDHYLIMGGEGMENRQNRSFKYKFALDSQSWMELWPSEGDCGDSQCQQFAGVLEEFSENFLLMGCT